MIANYIREHADAPSDSRTYLDIVSISAEMRKRSFRPANRAVAPSDVDIQLQIAPKGCMPVSARLINFSMEDMAGNWTRGAWAASTSWPGWPGDSRKWRDATVIVNISPDTKVAFDQANVLGPIEEWTQDGPSYGYRIKLGPAASAKGLASLKSYWEIWPKR